ncbi:MAG: PH domain-containing protein [Rickettsiales bacterium]|nr:PH domain-containing protein [Pseudomonadota bacterium]MDA0965432.1 PH domain-containing protein [Pseudomonadota bacterium]MDG4542757.1 PH domain-containing protein [Rickettsiales bacterium]MDG4544795.1 PH domain-containing protein [Rickettsiales bacterium]MDG4546917.1 PH domain-containing protein [Rickettsiales bacterium]
MSFDDRPFLNERGVAGEGMDGRSLPPEKLIYEGGPSQIVNFNVYTVCVIIFLFAIFAPSFWDKFLANSTISQYRDYYILVCKAFFFVPIVWAFWVWLVIRCHRYRITTERIHEKEGVFSRSTDELELFRIKDITFLEPFALRMFGCGNVVLDTSDKSTPMVVLYAIKDGQKLIDVLRKHVMEMRIRRGVHEID